MDHTERNRFLQDVFITAIEGGINYWADIYTYRWSTEPWEATIRELGEPEILTINRAVINKGLRLISRAVPDEEGGTSIKYLSARAAADIREALRERDAGNIDAGLADTIVQVGLFGQVMFG
jgi:hypothetical protein